MRNSFPSSHFILDRGQKILITLFILAVTACSSAPRVNVVYPTSLPPVAEPSPEKVMAEPPPPPLVESVVESSAKNEVEDGGRKEPVAPTIQSKQQPEKVPQKLTLGAVTSSPATVTPKGSAAYYIPKQMKEKEVSYVDLWIDRTTPIEKLKQELAAKLQIRADKINMRTVHDIDRQPGTTVMAQISGETIPIGGTMIAQLRGGNDFTIEPKEPVEQSLKKDDRAQWNWRVTPNHASTGMPLDLDIWIDPGSGKHWIDSYHETISVEAIPIAWYDKLYKIAQNVNAWLTLLGIGGIGGLFTWLFKKKK